MSAVDDVVATFRKAMESKIGKLTPADPMSDDRVKTIRDAYIKALAGMSITVSEKDVEVLYGDGQYAVTVTRRFGFERPKED